MSMSLAIGCNNLTDGYVTASIKLGWTPARIQISKLTFWPKTKLPPVSDQSDSSENSGFCVFGSKFLIEIWTSRKDPLTNMRRELLSNVWNW